MYWYVDDIEMKVWIDSVGDVVWNDNPKIITKRSWNGFLRDGVRLENIKIGRRLGDHLNGLWMILK